MKKYVFKIIINTPLILNIIPFCCSVALTQSCLNFCDTMDCSILGLSVLHHLLKFAQVHVHCIHPAISSSDALYTFCPQSFPASGNESPVHISWPKYWSFSFSISSSNKYSELISLKIDWFDLLAVRGTLRSPLHHHSLKASILRHSAFFIVQLSQPYMTTGNTRALTIWTCVGRVMSLLFNTLSIFVIVFLPRSSFFWFYGCSHHPQWF